MFSQKKKESAFDQKSEYVNISFKVAVTKQSNPWPLVNLFFHPKETEGKNTDQIRENGNGGVKHKEGGRIAAAKSCHDSSRHIHYRFRLGGGRRRGPGRHHPLGVAQPPEAGGEGPGGGRGGIAGTPPLGGPAASGGGGGGHGMIMFSSHPSRGEEREVMWLVCMRM